jgi:hypothetical protein
MICSPVEKLATRGRVVKNWDATGPTDHFVQFYRTDDYLIECLASYVAAGILGGERVMVIATPEHRIALEKRLRVKNVDVAGMTAQSRYLALDAEEMLAKFMVNGRPDPALFEEVVGSLIRSASKESRVRAFGEMVALLWAAGQAEAALAVEELWNDLARRHAFALYCAYPAECSGPPGVERICRAHTHVIPQAE